MLFFILKLFRAPKAPANRGTGVWFAALVPLGYRKNCELNFDSSGWCPQVRSQNGNGELEFRSSFQRPQCARKAANCKLVRRLTAH